MQSLFNIRKTTYGYFKASQDNSQKEGLVQLLYNLGFRSAKIKNEVIYYIRQGSDLKHVYFAEMKDVLNQKISNFNYDNPEIGTAITNYYFQTNPIHNKLKILRESLSKSEEHSLLMQYDVDYKDNFFREELMLFLNTNGFKKIECGPESAFPNKFIHYKKTDRNTFLIFRHYRPNKFDTEYSDLIIAEYKRESDIANRKCSNELMLKGGFEFPTDLTYIRPYLEDIIETFDL